MYEATAPESVVKEIVKEFKPSAQEVEGEDIRLDFGRFTVWVRDGGNSFKTSIEGSLPSKMKDKMDLIIKKFKLENEVEYL